MNSSTALQYDCAQITGNWFRNGFVYHIYPLGMLGCEQFNDNGEIRHRLPEIAKLIPHLKSIGVDTIYFGPIFESTRHGYDTKDYFHIDRRLGDDSDFVELVKALHHAEIRVIVDAVFNHTGRDFWGFREALEYGDMARTRYWFKNLRRDRNNNLRYDTWEGHEELVKLDLNHPDVRQHLFDAVAWWIQQFDIDGLRLDAADCLEPDFVRALRNYTATLREDFMLIGEVIHGDYRQWAGPEMMHGTTNYEAYKGLWSSHNDANFHEIAYTLNRQFGAGGIYKDLSMYTFADNHDVDRVASKLKSPLSLYSLYALIFTMPGTPSIYYGSEWGITGKRTRGYDADQAIRPAISADALATGQVDKTMESASLCDAIARFSRIRHASKALCCGDYRQIAVSAQTLVFERYTEDESIVCIVSDEPIAKPVTLHIDCGKYTDLLNGGEFEVTDHTLTIEAYPHWARILKKQ